jgi:mannose-6-phosphate isomerase
MAEIWLGTHPSSEAKLVEDPRVTLSAASGEELPFLMKILAAESPLSIQVHPNQEQAKQGFEREEALGLARDSANRNYKDNKHKPEILIALADGFRALCGFRPSTQIAEILLAVSNLDARLKVFEDWSNKVVEQDGLKKVFTEMIQAKEIAEMFESVLVMDSLGSSSSSQEAVSLATNLLKKYPGDTGALVSMLLNQVTLSEGQAIYLPAGNMHAYLEGLGIEVMASSDNVIRGGLTPKHIDLEELNLITDFSELAKPIVSPRKLAAGLVGYPVDVDDFEVYRAEVSSSNLLIDLDLPGNSIFLCTSGEVAVSSSLDEREVIRKSEALYLSGDARKFSLTGSGTVFIATRS